LRAEQFAIQQQSRSTNLFIQNASPGSQLLTCTEGKFVLMMRLYVAKGEQPVASSRLMGSALVDDAMLLKVRYSPVPVSN
jgi:hypothetical protein